MPVAFTDPIWLWLLLPAAALVVGGWWAATRTLPRARRVASLIIRLGLVACIVASLAGARLALRSDHLSVVFLVDASASMLDASRQELLDFASAAVRDIPDGDTAGVVVFGANALVDRLPSDLDELQPPGSVPVVGATDIAAAVRLGTAIFPAGSQQRLVLLSDGNDTSGQAEEAILSAAQRGVRLDVVLPAGDTQPEALVDGVDAPSGAGVGETVELTVRVRSTIATAATLRLLADGATVATRDLSLKPGTARVSFTVKADEAGFHVFRAVLEPRSDHFSQNNAADAYVLVTGEPQVLVATDDPTRAADLVDALTTARQQVTVVPAAGVPSSIATLAGYDAVVLDNVSAAQLGATAMASLQVYVRDLGKGLVMLGGRSSYGAGGYLNSVLEDVLPVYMTVRDRQRSRLREGRHRQGGDPARGRCPLPHRPARGRGLRRGGALGRPHRTDRPARPSELARLQGRWADEHLRRSEGSLRRPDPEPGQAAAHHPDHGRLEPVGGVRRAAGRHEGGGYHPLHHRHRGWIGAHPSQPCRAIRRALLRGR
jgi:hypothetical protein